MFSGLLDLISRSFDLGRFSGEYEEPYQIPQVDHLAKTQLPSVIKNINDSS